MKKVTFLTSLFALATSVVFGQLVNGDLETWTTVNTYEDPANWSTSNGLSTLTYAGVTVSKATEFQSGAFAAKLEGKFSAALGKAVPGVITTGTISGATVQGGQAYTTRSEKLTGYFKYTPSGGDMAGFEVLLSKWNSTTGKRDTIAYGITTKAAAASYSVFDVLLTYKNNSASPDSQLVIISSSVNRLNGTTGSVLFVDNLSFSGLVTLTGINESNITANSSAYPNPAVNELTITTDGQANSIALYDIAGRMMDEVAVENKTANVNTSAYAKGIYYYTVLGKNNAMMSKGKFAIVK